MRPRPGYIPGAAMRCWPWSPGSTWSSPAWCGYRNGGRNREPRSRTILSSSTLTLSWRGNPAASSRRRPSWSAAGHRRPVEGRHAGAEHRRVRDIRGVAALLVTADHPDHGALPRLPAHLGQERPAARPVRVAVAVELELVPHRLHEPVLAPDRLARGIRVADDLDLLPGRRAGAEFFGSG